MLYAALKKVCNIILFHCFRFLYYEIFLFSGALLCVYDSNTSYIQRSPPWEAQLKSMPVEPCGGDVIYTEMKTVFMHVLNVNDLATQGK